MKRIGLDVGSTTVKCVVLDENSNIVFLHINDTSQKFPR